MDMKRRELLGLGGVVFLAGCTSPRPATKSQPGGQPGELLAVSLPDGLAVLDSGTARRVAGGTLLTGNRLVGVDTDGRVVVRDATTGVIVTATAVRGRMRLAAVAPDASLVALVDGDPAGRTETTIVVGGRPGSGIA
ncbi:hypothetical protein [Dactylosporangium darangshiense]|uniref:hypothetical protein n=1 Tax=Dactylosporangium darangshiense TaxID=579108 RepID=UPI00362896FF